MKVEFILPVSILWFVLFCWITWVGFCALMALQRARDLGKLKGIARVFGYALLIVFIPLDFILEIISSVFFLELPRYRSNEWLFTARMQRYHNRLVENPSLLEKWRKTAGTFITEALLNDISEAVGNGPHA